LYSPGQKSGGRNSILGPILFIALDTCIKITTLGTGLLMSTVHLTVTGDDSNQIIQTNIPHTQVASSWYNIHRLAA